MTTMVIDASVAVKWFVLEKGSDRALDLAASDHDLIAPDIARFEIAAALSRHARTGSIRHAQALLDIGAIQDYFSELLPSSALLVAGFERSMALRHHLYDCLYLALAQARDAKLVTADAAFIANLAGTEHEQHVILLADWKP